MAAISGLNNMTAEIGRPSQQVLSTIKQHASGLDNTLQGENIEGSSETSSKTKGFAEKAVSVQFSDKPKEAGPVYTRPK
ncbi:MAG: hypothetical protein HQL53_11520 [Magnetococcales bacterium]|nr:hypothetical protein [Magnetococcales bacterium]